ncbi:PPR repeat [Musa troglodytarum]|uniref:PPR repeat n=1 Tax=Musa troglodytarum TaxID=320322 RepID=A0A9E7EUB9_9LILI|nr:PPR repeat [Musa troglodytarum]
MAGFLSKLRRIHLSVDTWTLFLGWFGENLVSATITIAWIMIMCYLGVFMRSLGVLSSVSKRCLALHLSCPDIAPFSYCTQLASQVRLLNALPHIKVQKHNFETPMVAYCMQLIYFAVLHLYKQLEKLEWHYSTPPHPKWRRRAQRKLQEASSTTLRRRLPRSSEGNPLRLITLTAAR